MPIEHSVMSFPYNQFRLLLPISPHVLTRSDGHRQYTYCNSLVHHGVSNSPMNTPWKQWLSNALYGISMVTPRGIEVPYENPMGDHGFQTAPMVFPW